MLVASLAGIATVVKGRRYQLLFFPVSLIALSFFHFLLPHPDKNSQIKESTEQTVSYLDLDPNGELLVQFESKLEAEIRKRGIYSACGNE